MNQNGTPSSPAAISFNGYTTYPSAFMVITADGVYSKHYYAGTQRILSRLGNTTASVFGTPCTSCSSCPNNNGNARQAASSKKADDKQQQQAQIADLQFYADLAEKGKVEFKQYSPILLEDQERAIADENASEKTTAKTANTNRTAQIPLPAEPIYYYHPDHLGTSTFLTDANGNAYQFFLNLPFGETMAEQLGTSYYKSPYKFNGKELDEETGLYYYGARYYNPKTSLWLSVDPLAEKYPGVNPYTYCMGNPINLVDPTGMEPGDPPAGELSGKNTAIYLKGTEHGTEVMAPNGESINTGAKIREYTYSDGKAHNGQQKKEGVWSYTNKKGQWLWDNVKEDYVLNTSDRNPAQNSFPSLGNVGTTYAGGDNPKSDTNPSKYDYSQPPQNIADFAGLLHDKEYDALKIEGVNGVLSKKSTMPNKMLISFSKQIISMYNQKKIDPFTGAPVSKKTYEAALNMVRAFTIIETKKSK